MTRLLSKLLIIVATLFGITAILQPSAIYALFPLWEMYYYNQEDADLLMFSWIYLLFM